MTHTVPVRVAYLTGEYPKPSHTFILREITAVRDHGIEVLPNAIRGHGSASDLIGPEEHAAAEETFVVLDQAKSPVTLLRSHVRMFVRRPGHWLRTLGLALRTGRPGFKGAIWQIFYFLEAGILADHLVREKVDHLHNHFADSSANVAMLTGAMADLPFSFTLHGPAELFEPASWHLGEKVARAAFTVCISDFARSQAMLFSDPAHWNRLKIVHCGIEPERYADTTEHMDSESVSLLFVGRLTRIKGIRVLMEALEIARAEHPDLALTLIGDGDDRAWTAKAAERLGGVHLLGFQSQERVAEELAKADALVLPSFAEGVPVVLMEAMASARPVVATQVGGVSELVMHERSGLIVPPGNAVELAHALVEIAADAARRREMGLAGRQKVLADFDVRAEAGRLATLFRGEMGIGPRTSAEAR